MKPEIKEKYDLLVAFCNNHGIQLEAMVGDDNEATIDINITDNTQGVSVYDTVGKYIN